MKECVKHDAETPVLDHTSEDDDWEGREEQVIQQNKRVLVQVRCVETGGMELALATEGGAGAHLLNGKNQNMANTQITFCPACQDTRVQ